jgi:VIT1/CCC1 family predicted Fe2+/Mn2+ transporter
MKKPTGQTLLLAIVMLAFLAVAVWFAVDAWTSMESASHQANRVTFHGYMALLVGGIGTLAVGVGLMALVFYSSRNDYDQ